MSKNFADYMYSLLFTPLRKVAKSANQWYIFFKVVGKLFDKTKQDIFRVRAESMIVTASEVMLPVHGLDRNMPRLKGETVDNYRNRLSMKFIIASEAGTDKAIYYTAKSFGYDNVEITKNADPARWAEATVSFIGGKIVLDDRDLLLKEINKVKRARTLLTLVKEQRYTTQLYVGSGYVIGKTITIRQG